MVCEEIMKSDVECVSPRDTIEDAARKMRDENIGFLPVCDQSKKVLGTLTDRDIAVRAVAEGKLGSTFVEEAMTREVIACSPKDDIRKAEQLMVKHHKSRVMCVDSDSRLIGVISLSDIVQREDDAVASQLLRQISEREVRA